ncbi:Salicylic acid-binding protein 2 [Ancistrocladus abbreviatus]
MEEAKQRKHFVLVHGASHGSWCWYKLKPWLENAGHRVTAVDLAASGINLKTIHEVRSLHDYTQPLLDFIASVPPKEKVVLVGHSLGGMNLALAMDIFPQKIEVAVFLTAFMPDITHRPSYVLEQYIMKMPEGSWLDTQFNSYGDPTEPFTIMLVGPKFMSSLYELSPIEDFKLGMMLKRPSSLFLDDLSKAKKFSNEGYGVVRRVYIVCSEDKGIPETFQRWMIDNAEVKEVRELKGADHMPMFCMPQKLGKCLLGITENHL